MLRLLVFLLSSSPMVLLSWVFVCWLVGFCHRACPSCVVAAHAISGGVVGVVLA